MDEFNAGFVGFCLVLCCGCGCGCDGGSGDGPLVTMCGTVEIVVDGNDLLLLLLLLLLSLMGIDTGGGVGELLVRSVMSLGSGLRRSIGFAGCVAEDEDEDDDDEEETDG